MSLWKLPDAKETAANVEAFLKGQINRLAMQAGVKLTSLSSPSFDSDPVQNTVKNAAENKMQRGLEALEALQAIRYTMDQTYGISPKLLIEYYIQHKPVWRIRNDLFIDHDSFPRRKEEALNQFADCWVQTLDKFEWTDEDRIDLHVYTS